MINYLRECFVVMLLLISPSIASAQDSAYFQPDSLSDLTSLLESAGFQVETDGLTWLIAPDGTRVMFDHFQGSNGQIAGLRVTASFYVGMSERALLAAYDYEATNPLASIAIFQMEGGRAIFLQRDIAFGTGRTPENILRNVSLLFQLIPYFQESLLSADPTLEAMWAESAQ